LLHVSLRNLLAHKLRLVMSGIAIVLGVAFVAGTLIFTDTLGKTFKDLFAATSADVTVTKQPAFDSGLFGDSGGSSALDVPADLAAAIGKLPGVAAAHGYIQSDGVYVLDRAGKVVQTGGAPGVGIDWDPNEKLSALHLLDGSAPDAPGEIALDTKTVDKTGYHVGDRIRVLTPAGAVDARLTGVFRFGNTGGLAGASLTAFDAPQARQLFGNPGRVSGVSVLTDSGVSQQTVKHRIVEAIGPGYKVETKDERATSAADDIGKGLKFVNIFLLVFAGIALFVGSFIILNTFSMLVAQRTRELALLRALGASRSQVTRSVLYEALALGLVGSTVGLAVGFGIATGLRGIFGRFGLTLDGGLVLEPRTVLWAYVVGVVVTSLAAYLPARRAAKVPPVVAMRADAPLAERSLRRRTIIGAALLAVSVLAIVGGLTSADSNAGQAAGFVGLGSMLLVVAGIVLSPVLSRPFIRVVGRALPRLFGRPGSLARENALRNPRRTAATASALMIGLALVTAFSVLGASANSSVDALINESVGADFIVSSQTQQPFTAEIAQRVAKVDGVASVTRERFGQAEIDGKKTFFAAVDPGSLDQSLKLDYQSGSTAGLTGDGLLVDKVTAQARGWKVGTQVPVLFESGDRRTLTVGGIYAANQVVGQYVLPLDTFVATGGTTQDRFVYVDVRPGADAAAVRSGLDNALAGYPVVTLKDQTEFKSEQKAQVNQLLLIVNALLVLSILIAVLGIVNTLAMSVVERTREIGLLRAVGMSRRQLRRMVRLESVVISVYGALLGVVLGLVFGVSLVGTLASTGIKEMAIPGGNVVVFVVVAGLVGVLAAIWPARRAARLDVLQAIATE